MPTRQEFIDFLKNAPDNERAQLLSAVGESAVQKFLESAKVQKSREAMLSGASGYTASVADWQALKTFAAVQPESMELHPAKLFELLKVEVSEAVEAEDADRLFRALLMLWKAVK